MSRGRRTADACDVVVLTSPLVAVAFVFFCAALVRGLAVQSKIAAPLCGRCGRALERRTMGEPVCRCHV
jgi:hypothetical protein